MIRALIVDDSALIRRLFADLFAAEGDFECAFARNGVEALGQIAAFRPDVVTLDIHMPGMDGLACLDRIMLEHPCPVVMVSSLTEAGADITLQALDMGAVDFVPKPGGAISLKLDALGPRLVETVRAASRAVCPERTASGSGSGFVPERGRVRSQKPPARTAAEAARSTPSCSWERRREGLQPLMPSFNRCRLTSPRPSWSRSICLRASPGRSPDGSTR